MLIDKPGILTVLKVKHMFLSSGNKNHQALLEETDLHKYQEENKIPDNFCKKNKKSNIQMKFSCGPCRIVIKSVEALKSHLSCETHQEKCLNPVDNSQFFIDNGLWTQSKGELKRPLELEEEREKLSRRERTKKNKLDRSIPELAPDTDAKYAETEYYFENGLRKVHPYHFTYSIRTKGKWVGEQLFDVFTREFRSIEPDEYAKCIAADLIRVNDKDIGFDYTVQNNDIISNMVHRHELPVSGKKIAIIKEDDNWVVVDKPGSIHVHPCGKYRHNSILFILAKEYGLRTLWPVHRLDRLTSGVLIFSKNSAKAREMEKVINAREVEKEYVCRVVGQFPEGEVVCKEPIKVVSIGVSAVHPEGKDCRTVFHRMEFKDGVSIVKCWPKTGRMHQIRVHLQSLGFPITNDPLYNSINRCAHEKRKEGIIGETNEKHVLNSEESISISSKNLDPHYDPDCLECRFPSKDPLANSLVMFLHALKYSGEGWSYQTELPNWARL